jgi:hypothetical protein
MRYNPDMTFKCYIQLRTTHGKRTVLYLWLTLAELSEWERLVNADKKEQASAFLRTIHDPSYHSTPPPLSITPRSLPPA